MSNLQPANEIASADQSSDSTWRNRALMLLAFLLCFRIAYLWIVPLNLIGDEAYYWDWSRQLAWGYYSKPPMIAWLIHLATVVGGNTAFAVRLPAAILSVVSLGFVYLAAERMYSSAVAFRAIVLLALTPGAVVGAIMMTIDAPLLFYWSVSLYCAWRMLGEPHWLWTLSTGVFLGLGLLSKQTMVAMYGAIWLFMLTDSRSGIRRLLPSVASATAIGLAMFIPVLVWNSQHNWIMFEHTGSHFSRGEASLFSGLIQSGEFLAGQMGVSSPVTFIAIIIAQVAIIKRIRGIDRAGRFLFCAGILPLTAVLCLSFAREVNPNWPAPFYIATIIAVANWLSAGGKVTEWYVPRLLCPEFRIDVFKRCVVGGLLVVLITCSIPFGTHIAGLTSSKLDLTTRLRGWDDLAESVDLKTRERYPDGAKTFVCQTGRQVASEIAFYHPNNPRVFVWNSDGIVRSQYDIWGIPDQIPEDNTVLVTGVGAEPDERIQSPTGQWELLGDVTVSIGGNSSRSCCLWVPAESAGDAATLAAVDNAVRTR